MSIDVHLLTRLENLENLVKLHINEHPLEHHDHLLDLEEHLAHHAEIDKPKENRAGERRSGERRVGTDGPPPEGERRAG